jgi:branched-chain amino acid transport system ATP-binding protein
MLEVAQVSAVYGGTQVLWQTSIHVGDGEVVALMGPNGSGKCTLMNGISGIVRVWSGEIVFDGTALHALPAHRRLALGISHVLERHRLFPYMTVLENLQLGCGPHGSRDQLGLGLDRAYRLFPRLKERQSQTARLLSGGEQQMCAIARGLMSSPKLLLVDEPFIGLSPHMREEVADVLRAVNADGVAVVLIEQNVEQALALSHRAYVLREGTVVLTGDSRQLAASTAVQDVFLGRTRAAAVSAG